MDIWIIWLIAAGVLLIFELLTNAVATLCIALGCLAAMVPALFGLPLHWQIIVLAVVTVLAFALIAPWINRKHRQSKTREAYNSNMDALIGRRAAVFDPIPGGAIPGRVRIDGDSWQALSRNHMPVARGKMVRVTGYDSIILIVEEITDPAHLNPSETLNHPI